MMYPTLTQTIENLSLEHISEERQALLQPLITYIQQKQDDQEDIRLNFICTHNSRRSHLSQLWAQALAYYYDVKNVSCYSGGTETTALFPKVLETLNGQGFQIQTLVEGSNPIYAIKFAAGAPPVMGFSKTMDNEFNPSEGFAAIMTCSQADEGCPFVPGAEKRIPITYEDPKVSDGTPQQTSVYLKRSLQIATELAFVFSKIL